MPHAQIRTSYDLGPEGRILIATVEDDPAAGDEISITVPGRAVWRVLAVRFAMTTSGTAASRRVMLTLDDGENEFARLPAASNQSASNTFTYTWAQIGHDRTQGGDATTSGLPDPLIMLPGWRIQTVTDLLKGGDNFTAPVLYVQEIPQRGLAAGQDALLSALRRFIGEEARIG